MRFISRRIYKLEQQLGVAGPTSEELRVWELVETVRGRRAERLGQSFVPGRREDRRSDGPIHGTGTVDVARALKLKPEDRERLNPGWSDGGLV